MVMTDTIIKRRDTRFALMPACDDMLPMFTKPVRPSGREKYRPRNGPPIDDWEKALIGRTLVKRDAADSVSDKSLPATLRICVKKADGALSRIPSEVLVHIEEILNDSVGIVLSGTVEWKSLIVLLTLSSKRPSRHPTFLQRLSFQVVCTSGL